MNDDDIALVLKACAMVKVDPAMVKPGNVFAPKAKTPEAVKEAIRQLDPKRASELIEEAGVSLSLKAEAVARGHAPMDKDVWEELQMVDPYWCQQQREIGEARALQQLEEQYAAMTAAAEARDRMFYRGKETLNSATGSTLQSRLRTDHYRENL